MNMASFSHTRAAARKLYFVDTSHCAPAVLRLLILGVLAAAVQVDGLQQGVELSIGKTGSQQALLIHANYTEPISSFTLSWCFRFSPWYIKEEDDLTMAEQVSRFHLSPAGGAAAKAGFKMTLEQMSYQDLDSGLAAELNDEYTDDKYALSECFILDAEAPEGSSAEIVPPENASEQTGPMLLAAIAISPATSPPDIFPLMDMVACLSKPATTPQLLSVPPPFSPVSGRRLQGHYSHGYFINDKILEDEIEVSSGVMMRRLLQDVVDPHVSFFEKEQEIPVEVVKLYGCVNIFHSQELAGCTLHPHSGDINSDLVMDIVDVVAMVMELLGSPVELPMPFNDCTRLAADGNADDIFDVLDAIGYLAIILGNECPINFFSVPCECGNSGPTFHGTPCL